MPDDAILLTPTSIGAKFERLVAIMARLRAPGGCPWDREQTFDSIKPFTLEETYEVLDAIDARDWPSLAEELGDLTLQVVFFAQMAKDEGRFDIAAPLDAIAEKLIRRHPHIFADTTANTPGEVKQRWDQIKAQEKREKGEAPRRLLDGIPRSLPALAEAHRISEKVAGVGFDWKHFEDVVAKLHEELAEIEAARPSGNPDELEDEVGDLLFTAVNIARSLKVDPEQALRKANAKFRQRFSYVEARADLPGATLEEMEALWQEAKSSR